MKYFLYRTKRGIKNLNQIKTKQISKRGKDKVWKDLERGFRVFGLGKFFCYFF